MKKGTARNVKLFKPFTIFWKINNRGISKYNAVIIEDIVSEKAIGILKTIRSAKLPNNSGTPKLLMALPLLLKNINQIDKGE